MASLARNAVVAVVCLLFCGGVMINVVEGFAKRGNANKPERKNFTATGTVEALLRNSVIQFTHGKEETCRVKLEAPKRHRDPKTKKYFFKGGTNVEVTGTAEVDFLRPGMYVRYSASFDAKGKSSDTIDLLTIFTPDENRKLGIFREGFVEGEKEAGAKAQYLVAGQLTSFKKGKLTIVVGGKKVQIAVADDVKIKVDVNDPSLARKGDKIEVRGHYFQKGAVFGESVKIELSEPLTGEKKKSKKPRRSSSRKPKSQK